MLEVTVIIITPVFEFVLFPIITIIITIIVVIVFVAINHFIMLPRKLLTYIVQTLTVVLSSIILHQYAVIIIIIISSTCISI